MEKGTLFTSAKLTLKKTLQLIVSFWGEHRVQRFPHPAGVISLRTRRDTGTRARATTRAFSSGHSTPAALKWKDTYRHHTEYSPTYQNRKMQIYAVRSSRVLTETPQFHQMQYDSNYHTQVVKGVAMLKIMHDLYFNKSTHFVV